LKNMDIDSSQERSFSLLQQRGIEADVLIPLIRNLEKAIGKEKAHEIARNTVIEIAREQGRRFSELSERKDLDGFRQIQDTWSGAGTDLEIETIEDSPERLSFNVTNCRFAQMFKTLGAADLGSIFSCGRDFALSEGYSGDIQLTRTQTIMEGASFCDFRYSSSENSVSGSSKES